MSVPPTQSNDRGEDKGISWAAPVRHTSQEPENGAPKWLGWAVVAAVLLMMAVAVLLGARQLQDDTAELPPTAASRPAIGSMAVPPQGESGQEPDSVTAAGEATSEGAAEAESEQTTSPDETVSDVVTGSEGIAITGSQTISPSASAGVTAPVTVPASASEGPSLLVTVVSADLAATPGPTAAVQGLVLAPTATDIPLSGTDEAATVPIATAFGRIRLTPDPAVLTQPTGTLESTAVATSTPFPTASPTQPPTVTATNSATPTPTASATATTTQTSTPTPSLTPTATPTPSNTPAPTATATSVSVTPAPTGSPEPSEPGEEDSGNIAPGSTVVGELNGLELRIEPSASALTMEAYGSGTEFEVLEPVGGFPSYPVVVDGAAWLRVRAEDGLVGWVDSEYVSLVD